MSIAIIPGRGGSTRIPRKNLRSFYGRPIIQYSIELAQRVCEVVYVSTEDAEIAQVARDLGARVIQRPFVLAEDNVGTQLVMGHAVKDLGLAKSAMRVVCLYPCAPLVDVDIFRMGQDMKDYGVAVGTEPLRDAGAFYWGRARDFFNGAPLYNERTRLIPLAEEDVCDINTERDWFVAENRYAIKHHVTPEHSGTIQTVAMLDSAEYGQGIKREVLTPEKVAKRLGGFIENGSMVIP